jgi:hypothetical protein
MAEDAESVNIIKEKTSQSMSAGTGIHVSQTTA